MTRDELIDRELRLREDTRRARIRHAVGRRAPSVGPQLELGAVAEHDPRQMPLPFDRGEQ